MSCDRNSNAKPGKKKIAKIALDVLKTLKQVKGFRKNHAASISRGVGGAGVGGGGERNPPSPMLNRVKAKRSQKKATVLNTLLVGYQAGVYF